MKNAFVIIIFIILPYLCIANNISLKEAKIVAANFLSGQNKASLNTESLIQNNIFSNNKLKSNSVSPIIYSFDIEGNNGYILVSSTNLSTSVIAYSKEGSLNDQRDNIAFIKYINRYIEQIKILKNSNITTKYKQDTKATSENIEPLVETKWGQYSPYNNKVATDPSTNKKFPTGCLATAMAQIMNYHQHPKVGFGNKVYFHSNNYITIGDIGASIANSRYEWQSLTNKINNKSPEGIINNISLLLYDCGVSIQMNYNKTSNGGSGAYLKNVEKAMELNFNYHTDTRYIIKKNYDTWVYWENLIIDNLSQNLPIIYSGVDTQGQGGHAWVLDGYEHINGNNYFHMNWGWNGSNNNYVLIQDVMPLGTNLNYKNSPRAIMYIKPGLEYKDNIVLKSKIEVSQDKQYTSTSFTFDVENVGTTDFNGKFFAVIFDENFRFVANISNKKSKNISTGQSIENIILTTDGINFLPGKYYLSINQENENSLVQVVKNVIHNTYQEFELKRRFSFGSLDIIDKLNYTEYIKHEGDFSLSTSIVNNSNRVFEGHIIAGLFDFEGYLVESIELKKIENLNIGDTLKNVIFHTEKIAIKKGKYILAVAEIYKDNYYGEIIGYENQNNEIIVNISDKNIIADEYENNNSQELAANLEMKFVKDTAYIKTENTNIHIVKDFDYYSLNFEEEYTYEILGKVHDLERSDDGNEYTCDVIWVLYDKENLRRVYDDFSNETVTYENAGNVFIKVNSYFPDAVGTYSLDLKIVRKEKIVLSIDDVDEKEKEKLKVFLYPNPASDYIYIENVGQENNTIEIFNSTGNKIMHVRNAFSLDISNLSPGIYFLKYKNSRKTSFLKFIKI